MEKEGPMSLLISKASVKE